MAQTSIPITESTLRELVSAGSVSGTCLIGEGSGFAVTVRCGKAERTLASTRGQVRLFANLNTAANFLRRIGLSRFEVNVVNYEPGRLRAARPDRAVALTKTRTKLKQARLL